MSQRIDEIDGVRQKVDSGNKVKHIERNDRKVDDVGGRLRVTSDEERVLLAGLTEIW